MLLFSIDRNAKQPVYGQIIREISGRIESGEFESGSILPPSRRLAKSLGVNRSTVVWAYQELQAMGYIESTPGSYSIVRERPRTVHPGESNTSSLIDWNSIGNSRIIRKYKSLHRTKSAEGSVDWSFLELSPEFIPAKEFMKALHTVYNRKGPELFMYSDPMGDQELRRWVAGRLRTHSVSVTADDIIITHGAQQALDSLVIYFRAGGKKAAVEAPTYSKFLALLELYGMESVSIPMRSGGIDLAVLEDQLRSGEIAFVYTMPNFHNPTGISTSQEHRERLIALCERFRVPIIEDGFEEEMKYSGGVSLPIKSMDRNGIVIYVGTFSKILFAGLRVGYIAAPKECIDGLAAIQEAAVLSQNGLILAALAEFCENGGYDRQIRRIHRVFRKKMLLALNELTIKIRIPDVKISRPQGGYLIWIELFNCPLKDRQTQEIISRHKVGVMLTSICYRDEDHRPSIRLSIARMTDDEIREGSIRLGDALREIYQPEVVHEIH